MKEFTRIITVQIEVTCKEVDEKEVVPIGEIKKVVKEFIENAIPEATYVNVTEAKDFIKD